MGRTNTKLILTATFAQTPAFIEITGFEALPDISLGETGDTPYNSFNEILLSFPLPSEVTANLSDGKTLPLRVISWKDTDNYNPNIADPIR